jgi:hypothetical protein
MTLRKTHIARALGMALLAASASACIGGNTQRERVQ